jgi:hypothetical protein
MKSFYIQLRARLDIEIEAEDAATARQLIDQAFRLDRVDDPLGNANIRLHWPLSVSTLRRSLARAHVLGAVGEEPCEVVEAFEVDDQPV